MNLINTLYPNGRYIISMTHPHFHPEKEEYKKGEKQTIWVRGRTSDDCFDALKEMKKSGEFTAIFYYLCGYRPAMGFPIPEFTLEVMVNNPSMANYPQAFYRKFF